MTPKEFDIRILFAEHLLYCCEGKRPLCFVLHEAFNIPEHDVVESCIEFEWCFSSDKRPKKAYWLDDKYNDDGMSQLERRLVFLESFKGACHCNRSYLSWPANPAEVGYIADVANVADTFRNQTTLVGHHY